MLETLGGTRPTRNDVACQSGAASTANALHLGAFLTIGTSAVAWVITLQQMNGMPPLPSTASNSSLGDFTVWWIGMFATMMLPGAAPAVFRLARTSRSVQAVSQFVSSYFAIWMSVGVAIYVICPILRVHGIVASAGAVIAAGVYELTPLKQQLRRRCLEPSQSGLQFGLHCVGSNLCLMLLPPLGMMNSASLLIIGALCTGQKIWPAKTALDLPLAVLVLGLGVALLVNPTSVSAFMLPM